MLGAHSQALQTLVKKRHFGNRNVLKYVMRWIAKLAACNLSRRVRKVYRRQCWPLPSLFKTQPGRYEFHLTSFAENWANLEAIYALLTQYGHPNVHVIATVSPVPLMNTFSSINAVVANTWAKSLLRAVAQEWAQAHNNVDYFPSYEVVKNSDRAAVWEPDLRHVRGAGAAHHGTVLALLSCCVRNGLR